jgi:hypothetical protein
MDGAGASSPPTTIPLLAKCVRPTGTEKIVRTGKGQTCIHRAIHNTAVQETRRPMMVPLTAATPCFHDVLATKFSHQVLPPCLTATDYCH